MPPATLRWELNRLVGLSEQGLQGVHRSLASHVQSGKLPGLVALVSRDDDLHVETIGSMSVGGAGPMKRESIFRIASLSKPITAAAAMILVDEGRIQMDESVDRWLPELSNRKVLKSRTSARDDTVPSKRPITLRHLLTFTMGIGSIVERSNTYPIQRLIREYKIGGDGPPLPSEFPTTDDWIKRLGSLPLVAQPGERWMYHVSADVLGVLISRVSGKSFGEFMRERLFEPLGMKDTGFWVPSEEAGRLPPSYSLDPLRKALIVFDGAADSAWLRPPPFESGGAGLVSTVDDYHSFCRMMLNKGKLGGKLILSEASVGQMTSDQLTPAQRAGPDVFLGKGRSWGFGMAVEVERMEDYQTPGRFGWDGGLGTTAWTDPGEGMVTILFTQRMMESPTAPKLFTDFWSAAYGARK